MIEELGFLNHWLKSGNVDFPLDYGINEEHFVVLKDAWNFINDFKDRYGKLPTSDLLSVEFEDFRVLEELDPIEYYVNALFEYNALVKFRPVIERSAELMVEGKTLQAINLIDAWIEDFKQKQHSELRYTDWVSEAEKRYEEYMKTHLREGMSGLSTGIPELDRVTGGWQEDDLILLFGRLGEGKSLLGLLFAYYVWRQAVINKLDRPVVFISTEMPVLEIAYRLDTMNQHFSNRSLVDGTLPDPDLYREYLEVLAKKKPGFYIFSQDDNDGKPFTPTTIHKIVKDFNPLFMVIDQLYDIQDDRYEGDIRKRIVSVTRKIRDINLMTRTPTILIAQAGRVAAHEAKRDKEYNPDIDTVQESDFPAQKATKVLSLRQLDNMFRLTVKKNRGREKGANIYLHADIDTGIYESVSAEEVNF